MIIALVSDVHSNLEAFLAVLEDMEKSDPKIRINLGDLVGYGPNPNEVIKLNREQGFITVKGNHDAAMVDDDEMFDFNDEAKTAIKLQQKLLSTEEKEYLRSLPNYEIVEGIRLVHGAPPDSYSEYIIESHVFGNMFESNSLRNFEERICCVGHTHLPSLNAKTISYKHPPSMLNVWHLGKYLIYSSRPKSATLKKRSKYVINVGSTGQPRDGTPEAKYCLFDTEKDRIEFRKVPYDFRKTIKKIKDLGLPKFNSERLKYGG